MTSTYASKLDGIAAGAISSVTISTTAPLSGGATGSSFTLSMPAATSGQNGYMTSTYASKLDGIASGAQPGTVTSVSTGNGLTGGTITGTGTLTMSGSYTGTFAVTGSITATSDITGGTSDQRLKTNIQPITNALSKVNSISGITYNMSDLATSLGIGDTEEKVGVLAQEIEQVLPQVVKPAPFDTDKEGNSISGENYKTVQYEKIVPLLIEAIKELTAKVSELESKINK